MTHQQATAQRVVRPASEWDGCSANAARTFLDSVAHMALAGDLLAADKLGAAVEHYLTCVRHASEDVA